MELDTKYVAPARNYRQQQIGPSHVKLDLTNFEERRANVELGFPKCCAREELETATDRTELSNST